MLMTNYNFIIAAYLSLAHYNLQSLIDPLLELDFTTKMNNSLCLLQCDHCCFKRCFTIGEGAIS